MAIGIQHRWKIAIFVEQYIDRVIIQPQAIEVHLVGDSKDRGLEQNQDRTSDLVVDDHQPKVITILWSKPSATATKGLLRLPPPNSTMSPEHRDALQTAIARARAWVDDLVQGRTESFTAIAEREGKVERHIRNLTLLAFTPPRSVSAIIDGTAPAGLTVTELAKSIPYS